MSAAGARAILFLTVVAVAAATWNAVDEYYLLENMTNLLSAIIPWIALPCINALLGIRSRKPVAREISLTLAVVYAAVCMFYALNGSTADRPEGAQNMHLLLIPPLLLLLSLMLACAVLLRHRFHAWRKSKLPHTSS